MALSHARPGQPIDISPLGKALEKSASHAILKTNALELIRLVLRRGETVPPHNIRGDSTLHCLEGAVCVEAAGGSTEIRPGQLVLVPAQAEYSLRAIEDASLLFTIQLPEGQPGSASSTTS